MCAACIEEHNLSDTFNPGANWSFCPICNEEIKRLLPHDGTEVDKYWAWVNEIKPPLPRNFKSKFTHVSQVGGVSFVSEHASAGARDEGSRDSKGAKRGKKRDQKSSETCCMS